MKHKSTLTHRRWLVGPVDLIAELRSTNDAALILSKDTWQASTSSTTGTGTWVKDSGKMWPQDNAHPVKVFVRDKNYVCPYDASQSTQYVITFATRFRLWRERKWSIFAIEMLDECFLASTTQPSCCVCVCVYVIGVGWTRYWTNCAWSTWQTCGTYCSTNKSVCFHSKNPFGGIVHENVNVHADVSDCFFHSALQTGQNETKQPNGETTTNDFARFTEFRKQTYAERTWTAKRNNRSIRVMLGCTVEQVLHLQAHSNEPANTSGCLIAWKHERKKKKSVQWNSMAQTCEFIREFWGRFVFASVSIWLVAR